MSKSFVLAAASFAILAAAFAAIDGTVEWFHEDAYTFADDVEGRWQYDARVAERVGDRIVVSAVDGDDPVEYDGELKYHPSTPAPQKFVIGEMRVAFDSVGSTGLDSDGAFAGVQVVEDDGETRFAVLDPATGSAEWLVTDVRAQLNTDYVIRYEVGLIYGMGAGRRVRYSYRLAGDSSSFAEIATVRVPAQPRDTQLEIAYSGSGTILSLDFGCKKGDDSSMTMDVSDIAVVYGTDFTNAQIRVTIENYWKGAKFSGDAYARWFIYDEQGNLVDSSGAGGVRITGDGSFDIGSSLLPDAQGRNYRYKVEIVSEDEAAGTSETVGAADVGRPGVHAEGDWFFENAATFAAPDGDPSKTGSWTYPDGAAHVTNGLIAVNTTETSGKVRFKPFADVTNDVAKVEMDVIVSGASLISGIDEPEAVTNRIAGLTVVELEDDSGTLAYAGWVCDESLEAGGRFVPLYGLEDPVLGETHRFAWTLNYKTGHVSYSVDDTILSDKNGASSFEIPESVNVAGKRVSFFGTGELNELAGDTYNANLAAMVENGVTNEYWSVDEAVAVATNAGDRVTLLWDATWRPLSKDVGRTVDFDLNGHGLYLDAATIAKFTADGYRVIDNGDGSYTIGVISYYLTYDINGGETGAMAPQEYSVTNMVFALVSNEFAKAGYDFANWNELADGTGPTNWEDGAVIDMTPYGLTNMTLFAQWKIAVRTVTVEAADEFVYIERVLTDGTDAVGVRYFRGDAAKGTGRAVIPVANGSDLLIRFSTDIEKRLTFDYLSLKGAGVPETVPYDKLPKVLGGAVMALSPMQQWAMTRGIELSSLNKSDYSQASFLAQTDSLLDESSEVLISDFRIIDGGYSFRVKIDGTPIESVAQCPNMIQVSSDLSNWRVLEPERLRVGEGGLMTVSESGPGEFIRFVIPKNVR